MRGGEMVGMRVSVEDPLQLQPVFPQEIEQDIRALRTRCAGFLVEVEDRIDDGAALRGRIGDDILDGPGRLVIEAADLRSCQSNVQTELPTQRGGRNDFLRRTPTEACLSSPTGQSSMTWPVGVKKTKN